MDIAEAAAGAATRTPPQLTVVFAAVTGGVVGQRRIAPEGITIGRGPATDWVLDDPHGTLSAQHCRIDRRDGVYWITDTSRTGIYLNGSSSPLGHGNARPLASGDRIAFGDYLFAVTLDNGAPEPEPASPVRHASPLPPTRAAEPGDGWPARLGLLALGGALALAGVAAYDVLEWRAREPASSAAAAPSVPIAPAPSRPAPDRTSLRSDLQRLLRGFACAALDAQIAEDGTVTLTGFAASPDDLARLQRDVAALPQVGRIDDRVALRPWPFCEVATLLRIRNDAGPPAPSIELSHRDGLYRGGDPLIVTVATRAPGTHHLYVDYFDAAGRVVHMMPTAAQPRTRIAGNTRLVLGTTPAKARPGQRVYLVAPPFGAGMLIALSSPVPLFDRPRPEQEDARGYLAALAGALAREPAGADRVHASQQPLRLVAR